ncbi:MAG: aldehyde ferredoxin oxidoreductase family protein [Spirochaetales bacterium]|nr:aldehyde ferredoxin oxidoreductase family protein [Spirochaetales bacterium]
MNGYAGTILRVDLTNGKLKEDKLDPSFARQYIGGVGFVVRMYLDELAGKTDIDPLGPDNPFVLMTGPLTGQKLDGAARWVCGSRSPLTGVWADCNVGGFFGAYLKFAGYDGIVITGASRTPVLLRIEEGTARLEDASRYWGMDTYETSDALAEESRGGGRGKDRVFTIGPAGENLVRFASIVNDKGHLAGRAGLGAVWGAKKLKAITAFGSGKPDIAHPERLSALKGELKEAYESSIYIDAIHSFGTATYMDVGVIGGDIPMKNWKLSEWEGFDDLGPLVYEEKLLAGRKTCYGCSVACKREAEVLQGPYAFPKGPGPEYETLASFGTLCLNRDIEAVGKANDLCNRYGMDTISLGATVAFSMECFEAGFLSLEDTGGIDLSWGNADALVKLVDQTGKREGFGRRLAEGSLRLSGELGEETRQFLTTVKGLEAPMHDPRCYHSFALAYATSSRGACHTQSPVFPVESGGLYFPDIPGLAGESEGMDSHGKAALVALCQDFGAFFTGSAVFCNLGASPVTALQAVEAVNAVTGFDYTLDEVIQLGRRIWYLQRSLSCVFGASGADDALPARLLSPLEEGPSAGSVPDMELMLKEYYTLRDFDPQGRPSPEVLKELGLSDVISLIQP